VTAFPPRWRPAIQEYAPRGAEAQLEAALDPSDVYGRILAAFGESPTGIVSATDLVCLIIDKCSGLFHPRSDEVGDKLDYLDVFAVGIGKLVRHMMLNRTVFY
jgi:hypothetical protein